MSMGQVKGVFLVMLAASGRRNSGCPLTFHPQLERVNRHQNPSTDSDAGNLAAIETVVEAPTGEFVHTDESMGFVWLQKRGPPVLGQPLRFSAC
jgi:hypothetical protein